MTTFRALAVFAVGVTVAMPAWPQSASERLQKLGNDMVEQEFDLQPATETFSEGPGPRAGRPAFILGGDPGARTRAVYTPLLEGLGKIPVAGLSETDRLSHQMLGLRARSELEKLDYPLREVQFANPTFSLHGSMLLLGSSVQPLRTEADFEAWLTRVEGTSAAFDDAIALMKAARAREWTTARALVERSVKQVETIARPAADKGPFWGVVAKYPKDVAPGKRESFVKRYRETLNGKFLPALRRYAKFLREDYLPSARTTTGIGALPGGDKAYRMLARQSTTTELTPDEIHAIGLAEVARIKPKMLEVARGLGFKGEVKEFAAWVRTSPANYPFTTAEQVLEALRKVNAKVEPELPKLFAKLPSSRFEIRLSDPAISASASPSYIGPAADGSRPGIFFMPVVDPRKIAAYDLTNILLHEGMPGHHLDVGRKRDLQVPRFRRLYSITAYSEGWGLYAESLGEELGVYANDPWAMLGRYEWEMHRAARLVVDTGMHAKGWTREAAIQYLVEERGSDVAAATLAIERYMGSPGQALAYKIGEIEIQKLRAEARQAMGSRFDLREFHEVILGEGALPLTLLRQRVAAWSGRRTAEPSR